MLIAYMFINQCYPSKFNLKNCSHIFPIDIYQLVSLALVICFDSLREVNISEINLSEQSRVLGILEAGLYFEKSLLV